MSCYHSDKCTKEELKIFKAEVIKWLEDNGYNTSKMKIKSYTCYGGDIRCYTGNVNIFPNRKKSIRKADDGNYYRSVYSRKYIEYVTFNRDEFKDIKSDKDYLEEFIRDLEKFKKN